jgi:hypothetical protein
MKFIQHLSFMFAFLFLFGISAHCGQLSIIDLKNRSADEIIRIIQPLLFELNFSMIPVGDEECGIQLSKTSAYLQQLQPLLAVQ